MVIVHFTRIGFSAFSGSGQAEASRPLAAFTNLTLPEIPSSEGTSGATRKVVGIDFTGCKLQSEGARSSPPPPAAEARSARPAGCARETFFTFNI